MANVVKVGPPIGAARVESFIAQEDVRAGDYCWATERDTDHPEWWRARRAKDGDALALMALRDARAGEVFPCQVIGGIHGARFHQLFAEAFA